ncbi:helix-turn-helix transcriptional regulator [Thalassolituus alkanivorans]|uniref:helix-turn-helix transcriptional regulator n=1 Tax=Thalassolituus alkanivorans TaxID=2881055 RepID=UPI001E521206|nr:YafY family protein [Thalassolituus alkanivorans]MCB2387916.1 YafY family transcriptional regulator [Thalassolituus alkanivorans]MCB2422442.1 YafY family transcriptional regulator [Thalassolituus alkanivorans]
MSRSQRLLDLIQLLRSYRFPVSGAELAERLGISLRTLYRDIATLQQQGANIEGEAGVGYMLRPGFMLPPLMFSEEELEALVLGMRWVAGRTDRQMAVAASSALSRIAAVLPQDLRDALDANALLVGPAAERMEDSVDVATLRRAIRSGHKVNIDYRDQNGQQSQRLIWPFALGYFDRVRVLVAWCEVRGDFRHFRTDRVLALTPLEERYPRRRQQLLAEWRRVTGVPAQAIHTADKN